jgi:DNA-binding NtrC family response regulator
LQGHTIQYSAEPDSDVARVLVVDDEAIVRATTVRMLERAGHEPVAVEGVADALQLLRRERVDVVVSDWQMPSLDGFDLLELMKVEGLTAPVVMVTGFGGVANAVAAIKAGAVNYLLKPFQSAELELALAQALSVAQLRVENAALLREVQTRRGNVEIVGESIALRRLLESVAAAARSRATVLLQGESGTGKELLARAIHDQSDRRAKPFVRINCAALPEGLIESTLFGHERGAFTGALKRSLGAFERANGGTLLLDEISEMRLHLQPKLLRVLQEREFDRLGGSGTVSVDVRVIATTNRDLAAEVVAERFRQDLYYRLSVLPVIVPPLRDRRDDIPLLAYRFASRAATEAGKSFQGFAAEALDLLREHSWPGNVRELQHAVERAVILSTEPTLQAHLFAQVKTELRPGMDHAASRRTARDDEGDTATHTLVVPTLDLVDIERQVIDHALTLSGGNRTRAAALLGIDVRTLRRKLNGPSRAGELEPAPTNGSASGGERALPPLNSPGWPMPTPDKLPQGK